MFVGTFRVTHILWLIIGTQFTNEIAASGETGLGSELNSLINKICNLTVANSYEEVQELLDFDMSQIIIKTELNPETRERTFKMYKCPEVQQQGQQQDFSEPQNNDYDEER